MKRLATLVLTLTFFAAPTVALADFHGANDVEILYQVETSSEQEGASVQKEDLQAGDGIDLWTRSEYTVD